MSAYITRRASGYCLRVAVPYKLRDVIGLHEVKRSLKHLPKKEARAAAQRAGTAIMRYFRYLELTSTPIDFMNQEEIKKRIKDLIDAELREFEALYFYVPARDVPSPDWERQEYWFDFYSEVKNGIVSIKRAIARGEYGAAFSHAYSLSQQWGIAVGSDEFRFLCEELQDAYLHEFELLRARMDGNIHRIAIADATPAAPQAQVEASTSPLASAASNGKTISEAWTEFEDRMLTIGGDAGWGETTHLSHRSVMLDFISYFDNMPLDAIKKRPHILEFRDAIKLRPRGRKNTTEYRDLSLRELIKLDIPESRQSDEKTVNKNFYTVVQFFKWCVESELLQTNPCIATYPVYDVGDDDDNKTPPFSPADLALIFDAASVKSKLGSIDRMWLMLVALFQGMRVKEVAQLQACDVRHEGGIWYIDINDNPRTKSNFHKSLKNKNSRRRIPIHHSLLSLGFLDLVESRRGVGVDAQILGTLDIGKQLADWFNRNDTGYLVKSGVQKTTDTGASKRFHSFRATFITSSEVFRLDTGIKQQLVGHIRQDISPTHSGYTNHQLIDWLTRAKSELDKMSYPSLDLDEVKALLKA